MGRSSPSKARALGVAMGFGALFSDISARAEDGSTPREGENEIVVWYRASEPCPSGTEFASAIRVAGRTARLAEAGDHVDYVVTLDSDGKKSSGRLERQTARGTIAISELRGGRCAEVAEALALTLALAVTPERSDPAPEAPPEALPPPSSPAGAEPRGVAPASPDPGPESSKSGLVERAAEPPSGEGGASPSGSSSESASRFWLGGGVNGALGVTRSASVGGNLFVEYDWAAFSSRQRASLRVGPVFRYSRTSVDGFGQVEQWLPTLGVSFCPLGLSGHTFALSPCIAAEAGLFVARSERDSSLTSANFWAALGPALRASARLRSRLSAGLTGAVMAPFSRPELTAGSEVLYRTPPAMFSLSADLSWAVE